MSDNKMYGVVNGVMICQQERTDELNQRLSGRNFPSAPLQPEFSLRPVSTKYALLPIVDQRVKPTVPLKTYPVYNTSQVFNPGNAQAPWNGFSNNINVESQLRNQFFALQRCEQSEFVPSSDSDLYKTTVSYKAVNQTHPLLFDKPEFAPFNPNTLNCAENIFNNSTVQCVKNGPICMPEKEIN